MFKVPGASLRTRKNLSRRFWIWKRGHIYIYSSIYIYMYVCICVFMYMYICIYVYMYVYIYICVKLELGYMISQFIHFNHFRILGVWCQYPQLDMLVAHVLIPSEKRCFCPRFVFDGASWLPGAMQKCLLSTESLDFFKSTIYLSKFRSQIS